MTAITFRPAVREQTPLIIGLAGPTKSGKTYSALRLAAGIAGDGVVAMINAEGARGHQYADAFTYSAYDIKPPFSPERYHSAILAAKALNPACIIIDSVSHMHDGPGGLLEYHDDELDRLAGTTDFKKRDRMNFTAWIKPKKAENAFIYSLIGLDCPVILCFRAKEKLKIVRGKDPENLGYQAISSDRITFETIFTLMLPPHCKGVPDLALSEMRTPFELFVKPGNVIDESLGRTLAQWAVGGAKSDEKPTKDYKKADGTEETQHEKISLDQATHIGDLLSEYSISVAKFLVLGQCATVEELPAYRYEKALEWIQKQGAAK